MRSERCAACAAAPSSAAATHRLLAIRAALGIEPLIWLIDVAGLSRDEAADVMRSTARALLEAAFTTIDDSR